MSIDWFTVAAQILNFLILVWLLKKYLYQPVLDAVREREKKIARQLADAAAVNTAAEAKKKEYEEKNRTFEQESGVRLDKVKAEAGMEKDRLIAEARKTVETQRTEWIKALEQEQEHLDRELVQKMQSTVLDIARKCLEDLADSELQERMTAGFIRMVKALDPEQRETLAAAMKASAEVTVRSALPLPDESRAAIAKLIVADSGASEKSVVFQTDPTLLCGIGLYMTGYKLEWTLARYLERAGTEVAAIIRQEVSDRSAAAAGVVNH